MPIRDVMRLFACRQPSIAPCVTPSIMQTQRASGISYVVLKFQRPSRRGYLRMIGQQTAKAHPLALDKSPQPRP